MASWSSASLRTPLHWHAQRWTLPLPAERVEWQQLLWNSSGAVGRRHRWGTGMLNRKTCMAVVVAELLTMDSVDVLQLSMCVNMFGAKANASVNVKPQGLHLGMVAAAAAAAAAQHDAAM